MGLPERICVLMTFRRDGSRLRFELWTTPAGDQLRSYVDDAETYARIVREGQGAVEAELAAMHAQAVQDGWIEDPVPRA